jgi:four helix bundle protein
MMTMSAIEDRSTFYVLRSTFYVPRSTFCVELLACKTPLLTTIMAVLGTIRAFLTRMIAKKFQELEAWQLANSLKLEVYKLIKSEPARSDYEYCRQIRKSAASSPRNIAEGFGRFRPRPFAQYMEFSIGSTQETHDALLDGVDRGHFTPLTIGPGVEAREPVCESVNKTSPVSKKLQRGRIAIPLGLERRT